MPTPQQSTSPVTRRQVRFSCCAGACYAHDKLEGTAHVHCLRHCYRPGGLQRLCLVFSCPMSLQACPPGTGCLGVTALLVQHLVMHSSFHCTCDVLPQLPLTSLVQMDVGSISGWLPACFMHLPPPSCLKSPGSSLALHGPPKLPSTGYWIACHR